MAAIESIDPAAIHAARERIAPHVLRTPVVRLNADDPAAEIRLKLENLQPIGSFKIRGAANAMLLAGRERLRAGVVTGSAGNMAQGVAWMARRLGVRCTVIMPDTAPRTKVAAVERLGGRVVPVPFDEWWETLVKRGRKGIDGVFVHPVSDPAVIAGNGTIGLEILEDVPDVETILVPYGGGGLSCGIAAAVKSVRPEVRVLGCEVEGSAPLAASLAAGRAEAIEHRPSFVDGIGGKAVLREMWPLVRGLLDGARSAPVDAIAAAVRLLAERHRVIAEGAGATPVAVALGQPNTGRTVCVVSGGNIDASVLSLILEGGVP